MLLGWTPKALSHHLAASTRVSDSIESRFGSLRDVGQPQMYCCPFSSCPHPFLSSKLCWCTSSLDHEGTWYFLLNHWPGTCVIMIHDGTIVVSHVAEGSFWCFVRHLTNIQNYGQTSMFAMLERREIWLLYWPGTQFYKNRFGVKIHAPAVQGNQNAEVILQATFEPKNFRLLSRANKQKHKNTWNCFFWQTWYFVMTSYSESNDFKCINKQCWCFQHVPLAWNVQVLCKDYWSAMRPWDASKAHFLGLGLPTVELHPVPQRSHRHPQPA